MLSCFSRVQLFVMLWAVTCQALLFMQILRQENPNWSGLLCPPPRDLPNPGIKPTSLMSLALVDDNNDHQILRVLGSPGIAVVETLPANAEDTRDKGSIPGSGRSPGLGNGNPLQSSFLENFMDRRAWQSQRVRND